MKVYLAEINNLSKHFLQRAASSLHLYVAFNRFRSEVTGLPGRDVGLLLL